MNQEKMTGARIVIETLIEQGVTDVFGYPGGQVLNIYDELSKASGSAQQPWEAYAGESYGPRKLDDKTFAYIFEGIGKELNGAYLWCTVEDGHNSVTSQQVQIFVGGEKSPPEITAFPTELNVEQDDLAEIRCVAKSVDGSQLSFTWYETDSGNIEDIRAVNRGTETNDTLVIDTKTTSSKY